MITSAPKNLRPLVVVLLLYFIIIVEEAGFVLYYLCDYVGHPPHPWCQGRECPGHHLMISRLLANQPGFGTSVSQMPCVPDAVPAGRMVLQGPDFESRGPRRDMPKLYKVLHAG